MFVLNELMRFGHRLTTIASNLYMYSSNHLYILNGFMRFYHRATTIDFLPKQMLLFVLLIDL